jgi:hypothetical protein
MTVDWDLRTRARASTAPCRGGALSDMPCSADSITITCEFRFSVHTTLALALRRLPRMADQRPDPAASVANRLFSAHLEAKVVRGAPPSPLGFCALRDCSLTLSLYSLITVVAAVSLTHAFSLNKPLAQQRASRDCQKINQPRCRAGEAQPARAENSLSCSWISRLRRWHEACESPHVARRT